MATKNIDWDNLSFAFMPPDKMWVDKAPKDGEWKEGKLVPFENLSISPAAGVLNYGQGLFEGMKAYRTKEDKIVLFKPQENAKRMQEGANRLCMNPYPLDKFVNAVKEVVKANRDFIPPNKKGELYIRPVLWGTGEVLGVAPAPEYTFVIYTSPVGPYFKGGLKTNDIMITKEYHRACPGGVGGVKTIGNYAASMYPGKLAKSQGFAEVLYLDSTHKKYIDEVGAGNFFTIIDGELHTPPLGTLLPGITRKSIMHLAQEVFNIKVHERPISYEEIIKADENFCTGTAAVISPIGSISVDGKKHVINNGEVGEITRKLYDELRSIQYNEKDPYGWVEEVE